MKKYQLHYSSKQRGSIDADKIEERHMEEQSGTIIMVIIFTLAVLFFIGFAVFWN